MAVVVGSSALAALPPSAVAVRAHARIKNMLMFKKVIKNKIKFECVNEK